MSAFLQPWMLWGLGLAAVPIVIHLLNRRRFQTVPWAAMDFLRAAFRKNQRRLRFENLLLLLIRTALIVILVFALARPFLSGRVAKALGSGATDYTVVIDNSYSMAYNDGVSNPFDRALDEALRVAGTIDAEDSFTLYLTNDNILGARPGIPRALFRDNHDQTKIREQIHRLKCSSGRSTLAETLAAVNDHMDGRRRSRELVLITDLQRVAWESEEKGAGGKAAPGGDLSGTQRTIRDLLDDLSRKGVRVHVVDVGTNDGKNLAVRDFGPVEDRPLVEGNSEMFRASVVNYGSRPAKVDVSFAVDGRHKGARSITIPGAVAGGAPGEAEARFSFPDLESGPRVFSAELPADALPIDDRRLYAGKVRERIRVLDVDGDPTGSTTPETFFLKPAIALKNDRIEMDEVDPLSFLSRDLTGYDLVILANVERVREEKAAALEDFVRAGGGLVIFLGDKVDPVLANRTLGKDGAGLLPGTLADRPVLLQRGKSSVRISLQPSPHPLLSEVLGPEADPEHLWTAPNVWGYYPVTPPPDDENVTVLLRMTDPAKSPALLEKKFGKGKVLLFTTSADVDWGDLPAAFVMPILWHQMVYYLTAGDPAVYNLAPFAAFERELPPRVLKVQVTSPNGGRTSVSPLIEEGKPPRMSFKDTEEPGRYVVSTSARGASAIDAGTTRFTEAFAVNVDAREGDVRRISPDELAGRYPDLPFSVEPSYAAVQSSASAKPSGEIWKALLTAVLVLLFLEIFLARRFGDYARKIRREEVTA